MTTKHTCDRRTDRQTDGQIYDPQDRASIASSRGKTFSVTTSVNDTAHAVDRPAGCVADIGVWTSSSRLRLNSSKTPVMWLRYKNQIDKINISSVPVLSLTVSIADSARDLEIDSRLTMSDQVTALCWAGYYQLGQLRPVAQSLPEECAKTLVQAFISSRLDYCNALLYTAVTVCSGVCSQSRRRRCAF